jgi:hypothetical protein
MRFGEPAAHLTTGIDGEDAAFFYLGRKGYTVVARRWSSGYQRGDLDLIAWQGPLLCFIEVKTRTAHDIWLPLKLPLTPKAQYPAQAGPALRAPVAHEGEPAGAVRRSERLPDSREREGIRAFRRGIRVERAAGLRMELTGRRS